MNGYLLDTNIISELTRLKPHPSVVSWVESNDEQSLHISVLTIGEIRKGVSLLPLSQKRVSLETWLDRDLLVRFADRILPIDAAVADRWGRLCGSEAARRSPLPVIDSLLAATALHYDLTFVTRDARQPALTGVETFNPWDS